MNEAMPDLGWRHYKQNPKLAMTPAVGRVLVQADRLYPDASGGSLLSDDERERIAAASQDTEGQWFADMLEEAKWVVAMFEALDDDGFRIVSNNIYWTEPTQKI